MINPSEGCAFTPSTAYGPGGDGSDQGLYHWLEPIDLPTEVWVSLALRADDGVPGGFSAESSPQHALSQHDPIDRRKASRRGAHSVSGVHVAELVEAVATQGMQQPRSGCAPPRLRTGVRSADARGARDRGRRG